MSGNQQNAHCSWLAYRALDCRTVAQIQRSANEPKKRNPISRIFYANKDEATIAAWRSDLDRILHVFEVRSVVDSLPTLLTDHLQTELALHTHIAVSDTHEIVSNIREGCVNTHEIVSDIREGFMNTHELVSDMHRTMLKDQQGADVKNQTVGNHGILSIIEKNPLQLPRLEPGSQFQL